MHPIGTISLTTSDAQVLDAVQAACEQHNIVLRHSESPAQTLAHLAQYPLVLFLVDLRRPTGATLQLCADIKMHAPHPTGVIALTEVKTQLPASPQESRIDDVLLWPFVPLSFSVRLQAQMQRLDTAARLAYKIQDSWTLIEITSKLVGKSDLLGSLFDMVSILSKVLEAERVSVVLVRPEGDFGLVIASSDDRDVQNLAIDLSGYPEIRRVLNNKEPLIISDVDSSALFEGVRTRVRSAHVSSLALFPIIEDDEVLGVIFLRFLTRRTSLEQRALVFCQTVANATAIALRNHEILVSLREKDAHIQQVRSEAEQRLSQLKPYEDFFQLSLDGMVVLSDTGVILFSNPVVAAMLRSTPGEIKGAPFSGFLALPQRDRLEALIFENERGQKVSIDLTITATDGLDRTISTSCAPIGAGGMILLTLRDVTDERRTARRLIDAQERVIETEKQSAVMEIAGAAAHEMNQPLTVILASVAMFRRILHEPPPEATRLLSTLEQETDRMAGIIRQLSKLTDYATKDYVGDTRIIDLDKAATDVPNPSRAPEKPY